MKSVHFFCLYCSLIRQFWLCLDSVDGLIHLGWNPYTHDRRIVTVFGEPNACKDACQLLLQACSKKKEDRKKQNEAHLESIRNKKTSKISNINPAEVVFVEHVQNNMI